MTRASDAARNAGDGSTDAEPSKSDKTESAGTDKSTSGTGSRGTASSGSDSPANASSGSGTGSSTSSSAGPARPAGGSPTGAPPRGRQPLPGPPPGARLPGPPMMGGPRYAPPPPPRRQLTGSQRGQLAALVVALIAVGGLIGYVVALVLPAQYGAQTTIQYNIAGENTGDFLKTDRNLTTQVVLITSRNVLQPVADASGIPVDDLQQKVSATVLNSSNIILIQVEDPNREAGVNLANAIAQQYLTVANTSGPEGYLQNQLNEVKRQQAAPRPGTTASETAALAARAATLQAQLDNMNLTANQSTVLAPAYSVTDPVSPNKGLAWITGALCGLIIALLAAINLTRRWTARS